MLYLLQSADRSKQSLKSSCHVCSGPPSHAEGSVASAVCPRLHDVTAGRTGVCPATDGTVLPPPTRYTHCGAVSPGKNTKKVTYCVCVCVSEGGARGRWKALKVESRSGVEETEALLRSLQDRIQQIHDRRHTLTQLVQHLHSKVTHTHLISYLSGGISLT